MKIDLSGKVALITGTAGGQGRAAALAFAEAGARVAGCDIQSGGNAETIRMARDLGGEMIAMDHVDLGDPKQAKDWVDEAAAKWGRVDILYNNASSPRFCPFESFPVEDWSYTIRNELDLVFYVTRFAWTYLQRQGGVVINTASVAGMAGSGPGGAAHAAAKGAIIALTLQLAAEGAPSGIRAVAISPGVIESPGTTAMLQNPQFHDLMLAGNMLKWFGKPEHVAGMAVFLASDHAAYITGSNIVIDGGRIAW